jgi:type II secretory pathway component PulF
MSCRGGIGDEFFSDQLPRRHGPAAWPRNVKGVTAMIDSGGTLRDGQFNTLVEAMGAAAASRAPLEVTLAALADERGDRRLADVAGQLASELERGVPIDQAVAGLDGRLPTEVQGLLRAGLESGDLAGTFELFAAQRLAAQRIARRIRAAIAYPLLIVAILVPLMLFVSVFIIPMFRELFEEFDLELPGITFLVLDTGEQLPALIGGILLFAIAFPLVLRVVGGRWLFHRVRAATPFVGSLWMSSSQREFAALLAAFLDLRLPMTGAVAHVGEVLSDRNMARACRRVAERLEGGQPLSRCLSHSIHFDPALVSLVAWGESQNLLPEALRISTEVFDDRIQQQSALIQRLLPPVTMVIVGMLVFCLVIGLMLPLLKLIEALSR